MKRLIPYTSKDLREGALTNIDIYPKSKEINHGEPLHIVEWLFHMGSDIYYILDSDCTMYSYEEALEAFTLEDGSPLLKEVEGYCTDDWSWHESESLMLRKFTQSLDVMIPNAKGSISCFVDTGKLTMTIDFNAGSNSRGVNIATDIVNLIVHECEKDNGGLNR